MQADPAPRAVSFFVRQRRALLAAGLCALATTATLRGTPNAIAQGETRSLTFVHNHTKESATITFKRWGSYDYSALEQLNWLARDWRRDEKIRMNPKLFDVLWEAHREVGSSSPIYINSAYRSPDTNAMLRRRSRAVAKHSQHMEGNAMDFYLGDVSMSRVREIAMRMQRGGVGYYPSANTPFVHLDVGSVRSWPRMTRDQLARLFPDERTVHLPAGGGAMAGYEDAKAMIIARGGSVGGYSGDEETEGFGGGVGFFAALFGSGRGGGGGGSSGGDDAGVRSVAMGNARAGESVVASAAPSMTAQTRSLRGRRGARAQETQIASAAPVAPPAPQAQAQPSPIFSLFGGPSSAPAPAPVAAPIQVAAVPPRPADEPAAIRRGPVFADLPMPPLRPTEFSRTAVASLANIPMPPSRPTEFATQVAAVVPTAAPAKPAPKAEDAIAAIMRPSASPETSTQVAAYAPIAAPLPPARPGIRSGSIVAASVTASGLPAHAQPGREPAAAKPVAASHDVATSRTRTLPAPVAAKVALAPVDAILMEFRRKADVGPSAGHFTGAAVKPIILSATQR